METDAQTLRRLGDSITDDTTRSSGNQRRYSRRDIEQLSRAQELVADGHNATALRHIIELERQLDDSRSDPH